MRFLSSLLLLCTAVALARPCDIFESTGTPCVAAHSMVRALYSAYSGRLYQVKRRRDNATLDIGTLAPGGFADAGAQVAFCAPPTPTGVPVLGIKVNLVPVLQPSLSFRHCDGQGFVTPTQTNPDHDFILVAALNGASAPALSFQSVNFPTHYIAPVTDAEPGRVGIVQAPPPNSASWLPATAAGGSVTLASLAPARAAAPFLAPGSNLTGSCAGKYSPPSASVYLSPAAANSGAVAPAWRIVPLPSTAVCEVSVIYDQSPRGNHLTPAPPGGAVPTPDVPVDAARLPVIAGGQQVFGAFFEVGQGCDWEQGRLRHVATAAPLLTHVCHDIY